MKNVLVIGASSRIATWVVQSLAQNSEIKLTVFLRHPEKLAVTLPSEQVITGDATNVDQLKSAIQGQDIVYASLAGDVIKAAQSVITVMDMVGVKRLIWTSSLGIYNEIPGEFGRWNQQVMRDYYHRYRQAADLVEASDLAYTIVRPAWLTNENEIDYETTHRNDPFKGTEVSRKSVAAYVLSVINDPAKDVRDSIGIDKPGTEADRPRKEVMLANGGYEPKVKEAIQLRFH